MDQKHQDMIDYVTAYFHSHTHVTSGNSYPFRNKLDHSLRVTNWVERICIAEHVDPDIPVAAAIFHDVGYNISRASHFVYSEEICRNYLKDKGYPIAYIDQVCMLVLLHDNKKLLRPSSPIELNILIEADNIDEKGAMCVLRDAMSEGNKPLDQQSYRATYDRLKFYAVKDCNNIMVTDAGKAIWNEHIRILNDFVRSLEYDLGINP